MNQRGQSPGSTRWPQIFLSLFSKWAAFTEVEVQVLSLTYVTQRNVTNNKEKLDVSPILIEKWGPKEKTWSSFPCIPRGITRVLMERRKHGI